MSELPQIVADVRRGLYQTTILALLRWLDQPQRADDTGSTGG